MLEADDINAVINFLFSTNRVTSIGLWGRSMGGVSAIIHASRDPRVSLVIADSAYSSLKKLVVDAVSEFTSIPKWILGMAMVFVRGSIKEKTGIDIEDLEI